MRRLFIILCTVLVCMAHWSLFAGGSREIPAQNNVYGHIGFPYSGVGYERAIDKAVSIGFEIGGGSELGIGALFIPRFYILSPALEGFYIGANLGYITDLEWYEDVVIGANTGYKFVFGRESSGFSLEPTIGIDYGIFTEIPMFNVGVRLGFAWGGSTAQKPTPQPAALPSKVQEGIYIGIITFGPNAEDITGGSPILLDRAGLSRLTSLIETRYQRENSIGTALFYAAHMGLANMKKAESILPRNLRKATMITFTDGLDVSSTGLGLADITDPGSLNSRQFRAGDITPYRDYISREIKNRKINSTQVDAYIMTILGDDVTDIRSFEAARSSLASDGDQYGGNKNISFSELNAQFNRIANDIVSGWVESSFTMITPQLPLGTRIRMTFNSETTSQQAQNAQLYIEGTVAVENNQYYLSNISYGGGLRSSIAVGGRIRGEIKNNEVNYIFPLFTGFSLDRSQAELDRLLKQWQMSSGSNAWQINSEYLPRGASKVEVVKHNAVIYLVLDKSSSIAPSNIPLVRQAAIGFIQRLYDRYHNN